MPKRILRIALIGIACAACSLPLAIVTGIFTAPLWDAFEARTGIESYGHSGPADWVYLFLWIVWTVVLVTAIAIARKSNRPAEVK